MARDYKDDVAVVSWNEKGFWQADLFHDASEWDAWDWESGNPADGFFTMAHGASLEDAMVKAAATWPGAKVCEGYQADETETAA